MAFTDRLHNRGSISTGYDIDNSLKLERANSEAIAATNSTQSGNRKTWTFSTWIKRTEISYSGAFGVVAIFYAASSGLRFESSDKLGIRLYTDDNGLTGDFLTTQVFRDTSAWYHIVLTVDSTEATSSNRVKLWINGEQVTDFGTETYPNLNDEFQFGKAQSAAPIRIGNAYWGTSPFSAYIAETHYLNGTAKQASDFGEYDANSGIWIPKEYTDGGYGDIGFYYKYDNASSLGEDSSGEGHDASALSNITSADQATDTPTNNFCTLNPLWTGNTAYVGLIQEGATILRYSSGTKPFAKATMGVTNGKWYWEAMPHGTIGSQYLGIATGYSFTSGSALSQNYNMAINTTGGYYSYSDSLSETGGAFTTLTTSNVIGVALNLEDEEIKYYKDGSLILTRPLIANMQGETIFPYIMNYENRSFNLNFGGYTINTISTPASDENGYGTFEYAPPSGYYALCTKNLAEYG